MAAASYAQAPAPAAKQPIVIGEVGDLDLERLRRLTDGSDPAVRDAHVESPTALDQLHPISLAAAIEVALVNNLELKIARADRDAAAYEVPATRAKFSPTTGLTAEASGSDLGGSSQTQSAVAFLRQEVPTGGTITLDTDFLRLDLAGTDLSNRGAVGVEVRQPLMRNGRVYVARREILDAGYDLGIEEARLQAEILRVTRDTRVAYHDTILAARLIGVTTEAVDRGERLIEASEALFRAARASKRDVVSAQIQLADDLALLARRRAELRQAQLKLRDVLGLPLGMQVQPMETNLPFRIVPLNEGQWIQHALRDRPEIRRVRTRLEQADLQVRVAGNNVLPKLDLVGSYRLSDDEGALSDTFDLAGYRWRAGLEFEIPFGNVAARERLNKARVEYVRVERELDQQRREVEREVRDVVIELRRNLGEITLQADKVASSRVKLEVAIARYRQGIANNLDVTDAQTDLRDAETDLMTAIFAYINGLARLEASIAGPI